MGTKKVSFRVEEGDLELLKLNIGTDNTSEAVKMAIQKCILDKDKGKVKTLFPYVGKKPPRIGREVVEAYRQSGCDMFIDLFCGSLAMLCYLPWDAKVIVNDINGNLTNLYKVIKSRPATFVDGLMRLPYSEVVYTQFKDELKNGKTMTDLERAVAYYYICFGSYRGRVDNPVFQYSFLTDGMSKSEAYQKNFERIFVLSRRLQSVVILNQDFRSVLKQIAGKKNSERIFIYADCPYFGTEHYYENRFTMKDHEDLAQILKSFQGKFVLSSKAKRELRKLYRSNRHYVLEFEETGRMPGKRHREQLIMNFKIRHENKYGEEDIKQYN